MFVLKAAVKKVLLLFTGKSLSEAPILESVVNPQYDERLFIEFLKKYKFTTCISFSSLNTQFYESRIFFLFIYEYFLQIKVLN